MKTTAIRIPIKYKNIQVLESYLAKTRNVLEHRLDNLNLRNLNCILLCCYSCGWGSCPQLWCLAYWHHSHTAPN